MTYSIDFDGAWKRLLELLFPQFIAFMHPSLHDLIDWNKEIVSLDNEFQKLVADMHRGKKVVDKLIRVSLKGGRTRLLYIHVEVQNQKDNLLPQRVYDYFNLIYLKYGEFPLSLVVLGDNHVNWRPSRFVIGQLGYHLHFSFPTIKLLDWWDRQDELKASDNPFALAVLAHLQTIKTYKNPQQRADYKLSMYRHLFRSGIKREMIHGLSIFADWIMRVDESLDKMISETLNLELGDEEDYMEYVPSWARIAKKEGLEEGLEAGREEGREAGIKEFLISQLVTKFGELPEKNHQLVQRADISKLNAWGASLMSAESLDDLFAT